MTATPALSLLVLQIDASSAPLVALVPLENLHEVLASTVEKLHGYEEFMETSSLWVGASPVERACAYMGVEGEDLEAFLAYDGTAPYASTNGYDTLLTVTPMPSPGTFVNIWSGQAGAAEEIL